MSHTGGHVVCIQRQQAGKEVQAVIDVNVDITGVARALVKIQDGRRGSGVAHKGEEATGRRGRSSLSRVASVKKINTCREGGHPNQGVDPLLA